MAKINKDEFISEIKFCIQNKDLIKAKALLQFFPKIPSEIQKRTLFELSKSEDNFTFPLMDYLYGLNIEHEKVRKKLYDLLLELSYNNEKAIIKQLSNADSKEQKCLYINIAKDLKLKSTIPQIMQVMQKTDDAETIITIIDAMGNIGSQIAVPALTRFLTSDQDALKTSSIKALSEIGTPAAINNLSDAAEKDSSCAGEIIHYLSNIQNTQSLEKIINFLASKHTTIRNFAIKSLTSLGPKAVPLLTESLKSVTTNDYLIHTLTVLGNIGDKTAIPAIQKLLYSKPENSNVRFGAYEALGKLPSNKSAISLAMGLEDPDEQVRMSAAKAINNNPSNVLIAGIKNMVNSDEKQSAELISVIIDSESDQIFSSLINWEGFTEKAVDYLTKKANPEVRKHFTDLLNKEGNNKIEEKILSQVGKKVKTFTIFAVDDSAMMLKLYQKKLHTLGFTPVVYQNPLTALDIILKDKPDLVITDLNMPEIDGLELTKRVRAKFNSEQLPIIMITTQSDFVGESSHEKSRVKSSQMTKTGVNIILNKPFKDIELKNSINELLKYK